MKFVNTAFTTLIIASLGTILFSISAHAGSLAFDPAGNLFQAEFPEIVKFTPDGKRSTFAGISRPTRRMCSPYLAFDDKGNLFVSICNTISKFTPDGMKSTFATGLGSLGDMAFDHSGNLFVTETRSNSILKYTPSGEKSTFATGNHLGDMAFDAAGNLFVSVFGDLIFKFTPDGTRSTFASERISPDTQWEYQYSADGKNPRIAKAGATETVLDLSEEVPSQWANEAKIVWAPDSKRFALNYRADDSSNTTVLYQLRGEKWIALRSPVTNQTTEPLERAQSARLRKMQLPKNTRPNLDSITREVTQWTAANTATLYAYSVWSVGDVSDLGEHFLFTLKFDAKGNWKIVKTHQMSDDEIDELH